jgi:hypothetical protein
MQGKVFEEQGTNRKNRVSSAHQPPDLCPMEPFIITGLSPTPFQELFLTDDQVLKTMNIRRVTAKHKPGYPCRVSLVDAAIGEELLLLPYVHHPVDSPYKSEGAIYIHRGAKAYQPAVNEIPEILHHRTLSFRGYDANGMMRTAATVEGQQTAATIREMFTDPAIAYLHIHNAGPGCYNCRVVRASEPIHHV